MLSEYRTQPESARLGAALSCVVGKRAMRAIADSATIREAFAKEMALRNRKTVQA
jgi:hypothetical protein